MIRGHQHPDDVALNMERAERYAETLRADRARGWYWAGSATLLVCRRCQHGAYDADGRAIPCPRCGSDAHVTATGGAA